MATQSIPNDQLGPGDLVRFDFELSRGNTPVIDGEIVESIKRNIWSDDRFDYQGSEETEPVDLETGQVSRLLSVYAIVRKTRRDQRGPIEYASLSSIEATVKAAAMVWGEASSYLRTEVKRVEKIVEDFATAGTKALPAIGTATLLIAVVVFYAYFFGSPKRGH